MSGEKVSIKVSKELYEKAEKFVKESGGFSNVDELVEFCLLYTSPSPRDRG